MSEGCRFWSWSLPGGLRFWFLLGLNQSCRCIPRIGLWRRTLRVEDFNDVVLFCRISRAANLPVQTNEKDPSKVCALCISHITAACSLCVPCKAQTKPTLNHNAIVSASRHCFLYASIPLLWRDSETWHYLPEVVYSVSEREGAQ